MTGLPPSTIEDLFRAACLAELNALKPGNVHVHAPGHGMTVADFVASAHAAAPHLAHRQLAVGARILAATEATRTACGQNTNLGILLLCAPLAAAAESGGNLQESLARVLAGLGRQDAVLAYRAIRLAAPGGLGHSDQHDVVEEPTVTLLEAMQAAAGRDRIAAQIANDFRDVFAIGVARLLEYRAAAWAESWAVTGTFLTLLAAFPDTHVSRKHGAEVAEELRVEASTLDRLLRATGRPEEVTDRLLELDRVLKRRGINPGTSADLTVASHFAAALSAETNAESSLSHRNIQS